MGEMNRSFRAMERAAAAVAVAPLERGKSLDTVIKERDEELALFFEMRRREQEEEQDEAGGREELLLDAAAVGIDDGIGSRQQGSEPEAASAVFDMMPAGPVTDIASDDFLHSEDENDKHDYDWLLTPPGTPLFSSLEKGTLQPHQEHNGTQNAPALKSRLAIPQDTIIRGNSIAKQSKASSGLNSSLEVKRPSLSTGPNVISRVSNRHTVTSSKPLGGLGTMPAKPTGSSRVSTRSAAPTNHSTSVSSKASGPACRPSMPSKSVAPSRSLTPSRSSMPGSRPYVGQPSKISSRAPTPTRQTSNSSSATSNNCPPSRSSSMSKIPGIVKTSSPGGSSKPLKQSGTAGFTANGSSSLRTSMPTRPLSASRGRPGVPSSRSLSTEPGPGNRLRRQSCSPARGHPPKGGSYSGSSVPAVGRTLASGNDDVNPVLIGNKMVERVIHARRLAPPKQENQNTYSNHSGKSSLSSDSSGFGRTLSKTSLDMALRHMDISGSIPNNLRPLMKTIPTSALSSVRLGSTKSGLNAPDSLPTSSKSTSNKNQ